MSVHTFVADGYSNTLAMRWTLAAYAIAFMALTVHTRVIRPFLVWQRLKGRRRAWRPWLKLTGSPCSSNTAGRVTPSMTFAPRFR